MLCHNGLGNYYQLMFELMQLKTYTMTEIEIMIPYELQLYIDMTINRRNEKNNSQDFG